MTGRTLQKAKDAVADVGTTATGQAKRSTKDVQNVQRQVTQVPRKHWNQFVWQFDEQIDEQINCHLLSVVLSSTGVTFGAELGLFDVGPQLCG